MRAVLAIVCLLIAPGSALACITTRLPQGEAPSLWAAPLELAGLCPAERGDAQVEIVAGPVWEVRVPATGRSVRVDAPQSIEDREDLAWLAASLVVGPGPVEEPPVAMPAPATPPVPIAPVPPPPPPEPEPPTVEAPTEPPPAADTPDDGSETVPAEVVARLSLGGSEPSPAPPPPGARPWAEVGLHASTRRLLASALGIRGAVGIGRGWARAGVAGSAQTVTGVLLGDDRTVQWFDLSGTVAIGPAWRRLPLGIAVGAGAIRYRFAQSQQTVATAWSPMVEVEARYSGEIGNFRLEPGVRLRGDVRPIELEVDRVAVHRLSPLTWQFFVAIVGPGQRKSLFDRNP